MAKSWQIEYSGRVVEQDLPYDVCLKKIEVYKRFTKIYTNESGFSITEFKEEDNGKLL